MFASFTGVSYDSVGFGSWFCSDNTVIIVMAVCGNRGAVIDGSLAVVTIGISAVTVGSTGWRGVVTFCGMWVCTFLSDDCVSESFFFVISLITAIVNCGSRIISNL